MPHRKVYEELRARDMGLPDGATLGTATMLCQELHVGKWALRHALQLLRDEGLVRSVPGQGSFVSEPPRVTEQQGA
jgi:DNA-binding GntR family transcriptional regulator